MNSQNSYLSDIKFLKSILRETDSGKLQSTLILGFLGSGKTTFANYLITNRKDLNFAAIVENNLPGEVEYALNDNLKSYVSSHGTIFSSIVPEISRILNEADRNKVDHLLVELADISNPWLKARELLNLGYLDSIIGVVDSANIEIELFNNRTTVKEEIAYGIIQYADIVLLNKADIVDVSRLEALESKIREIKSVAKILRCTQGQVLLPLISRRGLTHIDDYYHCLKDQTISLIVFESDKPFLLSKFQYFIDNQYSHNVFRMIGILWFSESPMCHITEISGTRFTLKDDDWRSPPKNRLVLVGQQLNTELLQERLQACLSP